VLAGVDAQWRGWVDYNPGRFCEGCVPRTGKTDIKGMLLRTITQQPPELAVNVQSHISLLEWDFATSTQSETVIWQLFVH
jgi:hypothetical protein